ncbi:MAG: ADP-ribosylglycohydrolase [Nitrospira sp.]|nr:ADP-ribosylglycohydrolase [Nitrospira sp.]
MIDNTNLIQDLISKGAIRIRNSPIFSKTPKHLPSDFDFSKVEGMLLGVAIGDALGATTEGKLPADRHLLFGEIRNYVPGRRSNNLTIGVPTDDTQLTFWTLQQLIQDGGLVPDNLAKRFCKHRIRGIGNTTKEYIRNYKDRHVPWYAAGLDSLGNGAFMRIAPILVPYLEISNPSMYADAALDTMITHNAFGNTATCVAFVNMLWELLAMSSPPEPYWWLDVYCSVAQGLEGNSQYRPRISNLAHYQGPLWQFTEKVVREALRRRMTVLEACSWWGSGASLFETVPSVLYILATNAANAEEAIIRAVNDTKDNDTIAAIVGAAVGALHGLKGIPQHWVEGLTGRTRSSDDGEVFRLIFKAKKAFWSR